MLIGAALLASLAVLAALTLVYRRREARLQLDRQLFRLLQRAGAPMSDSLSRRQKELVRSLEQAREQLDARSLAGGSREPAEIREILPRMHQQLARLEQDQVLHLTAEDVLIQLREWVRRLDHARPGSEAHELQEVARNALRIATGLVEEGDLVQAGHASQDALWLLKRQHDTLETTRVRARELVQRAELLQREAEACNAAILARASWVRTARLRDELERHVLAERPSDTLMVGTRLLSQLEDLQAELVDQLVRQVLELRSQVATQLTALLMWPPGELAAQEEVRSLLEGLEQQGGPLPRSLADGRRQLEALQLSLARARELSDHHERSWTRHAADLRLKLNQSSLKSLRLCASLPDPLSTEVRDVDRLRARINSRLELAAGWQISEEVAELLDREMALRESLDRLVSRIDRALRQCATGLDGLHLLGSRLRLEAERLERFTSTLRRLESRAQAQDYRVLEEDLSRYALALEKQIDAGKEQALELADQAREALGSLVEAMRVEGLETLLKADQEDPRQALSELRTRLDGQDGMGALEAAADWAERAPKLLTTLRKAHADKRWSALAERLTRPLELEILPAELRGDLEAGFADLLAQLRSIRAGTMLPAEKLLQIKALEEEFRWLQIRLRKTLAQHFVTCTREHALILEPLTRGTLQFYLSSQAQDQVQAGRALQAECAVFLSQENAAQVDLLPRLKNSAERLQAVWSETIPRARRFYEKQLAMIEADLAGGVGPAEGGRAVEERRRLRGQVSRIRQELEGRSWEQAAVAIDPLVEEVRAFVGRAETLRQVERWWEEQRPGLEALRQDLIRVGAPLAKQLQERMTGFAATITDDLGLADAEKSRTTLLELRQDAERALQEAVAELERSRQEQREVQRWHSVLVSRKQDMDWIRACLRDCMSAGSEGLNLREGLQALQGMQRALEAINLDLRVAETHDLSFQSWIEGVKKRAEQQFMRRFSSEIESLHERPANVRLLCAEVLAHIDAILSTQSGSAEEIRRVQVLQTEGDAFHKLFKKRFSFQEIRP